MKASEVKVGGLYTARVDGGYKTVQVTGIRTVLSLDGGSEEVYDYTDKVTGKTGTFRSAAKFRGEVILTAPRQVYNEETEEWEEEQLPSAATAAVTAPAPTSGFAAQLAAYVAPVAVTSGVKLTAEQENGLAVAKALQGRKDGKQRVVVLKAGAGSGKTFELQQMEGVLSGILQYTAYNKSLVVDSTPKFKRANCATTHKLAFAAVGRQYQHRLNGPRVRSTDIARLLGINDYVVTLPESMQPPKKNPDDKPTVKTLPKKWLAVQVMEAIKRFCQSADSKLTERHFARVDGIDDKGSYENSNKVKAYLLSFALKMWADIENPAGTLPFQHDCYVKLWQLGTGDNKPVIAADVIMLDEYQDTAPVMVDILKQQSHAMLVLVGDDNQRIYEWRGAINAGDEFPNAPRCLLSKSFRFGQTVADVANSVLAGLEEPTDLVMQGFEKIPSRVCKVENPRCYLYRTNAGAIGRLMAAMDEGKRGHLIGGSKEVVAFCRAAIELQQGRTVDHSELGCFANWKEVQEFSEEEEGADLKLMVKLIDQFKADRIVSALENMPAEDKADLILSTAHRSKGREWPSVKLGQDFPTANKLTDADRRLVYVAATRAQEELDITECPTFCGGWDKVWGEEGATSEWIPGIPVKFTVPMPTADELAAYRSGSGKPVERPKPNVGINDAGKMVSTTPTQQSTTNGNAAEFTWANMDGWCVRGPKGNDGKTVTVVKKNGQKQQIRLGAVKKKLGDWCFYATV